MVSSSRIEARMAELGLNPYSTAKQAGLGADYVRDLLRGKVKQPSAARLRELAIVLRSSPEYLMGIGDDHDLGDSPPVWDNRSALEAVNLRVAYTIKDGFFEGANPHAIDKDQSKWVLSAIKDGDEWLEAVKFSAVPQIGAGSFVHVIEPDKYEHWLSPYVVAERKRDDGTLTERSVRRVHIEGDYARFGGVWRDRQPKLTLHDLKAGADPLHGRIVGAIVRSYSFFMAGTTWDDIPF